jgi:hypothetical protein
VIEENSPEMQRALAPYLDSVAEFNRKVNDRNAEAEEEHAKREQAYAEKDQQQKAELGQILAKKEADRKAAEQAAGQNRNPNDAWRSSSRQQIQDFQFGPEDEGPAYHGSAQPAMPTAPVAQEQWAAPRDSWSAPTPPAPPTPEPPPQAAPPPRSRPPARHQRSTYGEDDDDMSNQSWLQ